MLGGQRRLPGPDQPPAQLRVGEQPADRVGQRRRVPGREPHARAARRRPPPPARRRPPPPPASPPPRPPARPSRTARTGWAPPRSPPPRPARPGPRPPRTRRRRPPVPAAAPAPAPATRASAGPVPATTTRRPGCRRRSRGTAASRSCTPFSYTSRPQYATSGPSAAHRRRAAATRSGPTCQRAASTPLGTTSTLPAGRSNSRVTSQRMYAEHVTTRRASNVSHHSTEWIVRFSGPGSQPWCRPASVECRVATSGTPRWCSSVVAACATSQSCACTTSNERPVAGRQPGPDQRVVERHRPGQQVVGEAEPGRVLGRPDHPHPAGDLVVRDARRCPGAGSARSPRARPRPSPRPARARAGRARRPSPAGTPRTASARASGRCCHPGPHRCVEAGGDRPAGLIHSRNSPALRTGRA